MEGNKHMRARTHTHTHTHTHTRQQHKRNEEIRSAYKVRQIEEASLYSHLENLKDLVSTEAKKEVPVLSIIKETQNDLKQQLEKCKQVNKAYLMLLGPEEMRTEG